MFIHIHRLCNIKSELYHNLWTLGDLLCQCRFILGEKCTILLSKVDDGAGDAHVGEGNRRVSSVPSPQICCEPKTALKKRNLNNVFNQ